MKNKIFLLLIPLHIFATEILDLEMSDKQRKKTGVYKLSRQEKASLQKWIDDNYSKRDAPINSKTQAVHPSISETMQHGRLIRLSDGTLWEIHPADRPIALGWITAVEILITESPNLDYPYKLINSLTQSPIRAKKR